MKSYKKLANASIKILNSGKIKIKKGKKISIVPFVKESIENSIVSRLDGIISKEEVTVDNSKEPRIDTSMLDELSGANLMIETNGLPPDNTATILVSVSKNKVPKLLNMLNDDILGLILRTSTLAACYSQIRESWISLNTNDKSQFTNILYIPKILVFLDSNTGNILKKPFCINLMIVAEPTIANMSDGVEQISEEAAVKRTLANLVEASIKCGCHNVVINPMAGKILSNNIGMSGDLWKEIVTSERFKENIKFWMFSIPDEMEFITFSGATLFK